MKIGVNKLYNLSGANHVLKVLTVRASQPQEKHFHTEWKGMERPGHNTAGPRCTLPPVLKALPLYSNDLQIQAVSTEKSTYRQYVNFGIRGEKNSKYFGPSIVEIQ